MPHPRTAPTAETSAPHVIHNQQLRNDPHRKLEPAAMHATVRAGSEMQHCVLQRLTQLRTDALPFEVCAEDAVGTGVQTAQEAVSELQKYLEEVP